MGGVGITMAGSQISAITGTKNSGDDFIAQVKSLAGQFEHIRWPTLVLAASALALLAALGRWAPRMPGPLAAVAVATVAVSALPSANSGFALVGQVPAGLPIPGVPHVDLGQLGTLVMPAMGVAVVAFSDNILTARVRNSPERRHQRQRGATCARPVQYGIWFDARLPGEFQR